MHILVAYASKYNSTAEIAEAIGDVIRTTAHSQVDVVSVEKVKSIVPYDAIIVGSAIYAGQWRLQAMDFLRKFETQLSQKPVWLFSSGPVGHGLTQGNLQEGKLPKGLMSIVERIKPQDTAVFNGKIDTDLLNTIEGVMVKLADSPPGDFRNWDEIKAWAHSITQVLQEISF